MRWLISLLLLAAGVTGAARGANTAATPPSVKHKRLLMI